MRGREGGVERSKRKKQGLRRILLLHSSMQKNFHDIDMIVSRSLNVTRVSSDDLDPSQYDSRFLASTNATTNHALISDHAKWLASVCGVQGYAT